MPTNRDQLVELIDRGAIAPDRIDQAVALAGIYPDARAWRVFLDQVLLWLGCSALAGSVLFFIAYNWSDWGRFARFALVEGALFASVVAYWVFGANTLAGRAALLVATLLLGVLLALFGQVYQTGADPWQLFWTWSLLMLPWALLGRFAVLWLIWLALINIAVLLYYQTFGRLFGPLFSTDHAAYWLLFLVNSLAWVAWELGSRRWPWLDLAWARRSVALASGAPITGLCLVSIIGYGISPMFSLAVYGAWLAGLYVVYRHRIPDLFMLAGGCVSAIVVLVVLLGDSVLEHADAGGFLLLALAILGLSALAATWLKRVHRELNP